MLAEINPLEMTLLVTAPIGFFLGVFTYIYYDMSDKTIEDLVMAVSFFTVFTLLAPVLILSQHSEPSGQLLPTLLASTLIQGVTTMAGILYTKHSIKHSYSPLGAQGESEGCLYRGEYK